jgi:hypothetical protein
VEKLEMLLDAGEVAPLIARCYLEQMRHPEAAAAAFAKGKLERLVGQRTGGG